MEFIKETEREKPVKQKATQKSVESEKPREEGISRQKWSLLSSAGDKIPNHFFKLGPLHLAARKSWVTLIRMVSVERWGLNPKRILCPFPYASILSTPPLY